MPKRLASYPARRRLLRVIQSLSIVPLVGEEWKDISWTDGKYQVSSNGRVRCAKSRRGICKILRPKSKGGYFAARIKLKTGYRQRPTHRLVAEAFFGPCPTGMQVIHKDGNKENNHWKNLEYVTAQGNCRHAVQSGLRKKYGSVYWNTKDQRWRARIRFMGDDFYLGNHRIKRQAEEALAAKVRELQESKKLGLGIAA
jgi:HNH endonuclease/NUMOD4 motif-containing protein